MDVWLRFYQSYTVTQLFAYGDSCSCETPDFYILLLLRKDHFSMCGSSDQWWQELLIDLSFSLVDLWQGRVMYVHSGSEEQNDFFMFSVFCSSKNQLPLFLKGNRLHRFDISVSPVNDAPVLSLPEGNLFTMLENSKRQVGDTGS